MRRAADNGGLVSSLLLPRANEALSGVSKLPRTITINGTTVDSATSGFFYDFTQAQGASGSMTLAEANGQADGALTEAGGGALTRGTGGPFTDGSTGVTGDGTGYLEAAASSWASWSTNDVLLMATAKVASADTDMIFATRQTAGGYQLYFNVGVTTAYIRDASGNNVTIAGSTAYPIGATVYIMLVLDRSGYGQIYTQGVADGAAVDISGVGDISNSDKLTMFAGSQGYGPYEYSGTIYQAAGWAAASGWLDSHLQPTLAAERFSRVFGHYAPLARNADQHLSVSRAGTRYFQVGGSIYPLGTNGHCVEEDADGAQYLSVYGERTNLLPYSNDSDNWTAPGVTKSKNQGASPISGIDWNRIVETDASSEHGAYRPCVAATGAGAQFCAWMLVKNGDRRYVVLSCYRAAQGDPYVCADLQNGVITDYGAGGVDSLDGYGIIPVDGAGAYIVWLTATHATAAVRYAWPRILPSGLFSARNYVGDSTTYDEGILIGHMQIEEGSCPGPVITTAAAAATKAAEALSLDADMMPDNEWSVTLEVRKHAVPSVSVPILSYSDGTSAENFEIGLTSDGYARAISESASGDNGSVIGAVDLCDGEWHEITVTARANRLRLGVDGSVIGTDTTSTLPASPDTLHLGSNYDASVFLDGDIRRVRINNKAVI